ncbi:MAG: translocation/assembly module TamB domain-containing protein [Caulobacteraceae bacterium]|nr:translocation/assembly module TamB domain-containing protein [Caulobacteraceae bacterium]
MTEAPPDPAPETPETAQAAPTRPKRSMRWRYLVASVAGGVAMVILAMMAVVRFGVETDVGRAFVVARLDGLSLGSLGRLRVSGLKGDLWDAFSLDRLAIEDGKGAWLDARRLKVEWSPLDLFQRRLHVEDLLMDQLVLGHRPDMGAGGGGGSAGMPVSIVLDRMAVRVETLPAFSVERGLFQINASLDLERKGGIAGAIQGRNLLHPGDGLDATFDLGVGRRVELDARGRESRGGAVAGILGLPVAQALRLDAKANGTFDKGDLGLSIYSGVQQIAQASGAWTKAGGVAHGRLSLAASTWTAHWMQALGPELVFSTDDKPVKGKVREIGLQLATENVSLSARGPMDTAKHRSDAGIALDVTAKDLSRLVSYPVVGPTHVAGVLKGAQDDWRFEGKVAAEKLSVAGYALAGAAGPAQLTYRKREYRLVATADGTGGQGDGLLATVAGARPHINLDGSRLPDGRYLLRSVKAQGAGLRAEATGSIGLLGDLNFKGQAHLENLANARAGAKGALDATWSASQSSGKKPWKLSADIKGANLVAGLGQFDRLLGATPRLALEGTYDAGDIVLAKADLTGAAAKASGKGTIGKDGALKLGLDWSAQGPFTAGPMEIAGKAQGRGAITGAWATPKADLVADFDRVDLPQLPLTGAHLTLSIARAPNAIGGDFNLTAGGQYGPARAKAGYQFVADGVELSDVDASAGGAAAKGALGLRHGAVSTADLTVGVGPGAFLVQGRADARLKVTAPSGGSPEADLDLSGHDLLLKGSTALVHTVAITAHGPLALLPYTINAEVQADQAPVKVAGSGAFGRTAKGFSASFNGQGRFRRTDFRTVNPAQFLLEGADRSAKLDLSLGGGHALIEARQTTAGLNAKAALTGVDLGTLGEDLAGRFDANLALSGEGEHLQGSLDARLQGARSRDAPTKLALNSTVKGVLEGDRITLDATVDGAGATADHATLHAILPAEAAAAPFRIAIDRTKPIAGQFSANGELGPIWELFYGGERELGGQLVAEGALGGSINAPRITGHGALNNGQFEDASTGLKLRQLTAEVDITGDAIDVKRFSARDAKSGVLSGDGRMDFGANASSTLTLNAKNFQLLDNETAKATASGAVTVVRDAAGKAILSGALTIDRADISAESGRSPPGVVTMDVVERNKPYSPGGGIQAPTALGPGLALNVKITAPRRIFVKGLGLDAELSLDAQVVGTTSAPVLQGVARIVRGDYDFAGKRFQIDDRGVVYLATTTDKIRLDLKATREDTNITAIIGIQGTAAKPQITLSSTPTRPDDEVLSQVLFGTSAAQLSPVEAAQLAAALTTLATGGGFDVMGGLKNFARLDRLALGGGDSSTGVTVSGGKYIGNHVYVELTGGGRQGASAQVEIKATKALSFVSQIGGEVGAKLSIRWRKDYGRAKPPASPGK